MTELPVSRLPDRHPKGLGIDSERYSLLRVMVEGDDMLEFSKNIFLLISTA